MLGSLPPAVQADVLMRIAKLEHIPSGVIQESRSRYCKRELRATGSLETDQVGGIKAVAEILNNDRPWPQSAKSWAISKSPTPHWRSEIRATACSSSKICFEVDDRGHT